MLTLSDMESLWREAADRFVSLEASVDALAPETRWSRDGVGFLPVELERIGITPEPLESLGRRVLRTGVRVDLVDGRVVRTIGRGVVAFREWVGSLVRELGYAEVGDAWILRGVRVLGLADDGVSVWGRAMGRPREATTSCIEESYDRDGDRIVRIRREMTQTDRGRELRSSIDFDVVHGADGVVTDITATSRRAAPATDVTERVYPRST